MEALIDSSVLVAVFNENDALHKKALKTLAECTRPFVVHEYVVGETATVLMHRAGKQPANAFVRGILTNKDIIILYSSETVFRTSVQIFAEALSKQLSFIDTVLLCLSQRYQIVTFDEGLNRAIKKKVGR